MENEAMSAYAKTKIRKSAYADQSLIRAEFVDEHSIILAAETHKATFSAKEYRNMLATMHGKSSDNWFAFVGRMYDQGIF
jgi:hypothetical protein